MRTVHINTSNEYDVLIGSGLLEQSGELIRNIIKAKKLCIVTDDTVDTLYAKKVTSSLNKSGFEVIKFVFPHGEESKSAEIYLSLMGFLAKKNYYAWSYSSTLSNCGTTCSGHTDAKIMFPYGELAVDNASTYYSYYLNSITNK